MPDCSLVASLTIPPSASGAELAALPPAVEWLEVRADLLGDLNPDWLRNHFGGRLLYSLRSRAEGGACPDANDRRQQRLAAAARLYDRVELEGLRDNSESLLARIPAEQRLVSWHGPADDLATLKARFGQLSSIQSGVYKLVTRAARMSDEFTALSLLKSLGRSDTIAYSEGPLGFWSRVVTLHLGAPAIFGLVPQGPAIPTEPSVNKLIDDFGLPLLRPPRKLFAIIGDPVFHSLSPRLHNAAYRALDYPALFVPLRVESFSEFWHEVVQAGLFESLGIAFNGMTVASPHKEAALLTTSLVSPMARRAESANILVRDDGRWRADTTDPEVIYMARRERNIWMRQRHAAVIGCGGAGRGIAAALADAGATVMLINRGTERGQHAARLLGLPYTPLPEFDAGRYDMVINATPVGRDSDEAPFKLETLNREAVVIDLVYGSKPTPLVASTSAREQVVIDGRDVLLTQVLRQFRMMTGKTMPATVAQQILARRAPSSGAADPAQSALSAHTFAASQMPVE
ncbi:MAG: 3-dehydroquinate dehydratase / shikimate dehydrogenase [Acidobacteriota bacterium]|jgi:3-dehydroquinate dehydratase/shikimate dehydrogenase|nr:3-dehydroquinate dehydratase / shikimate dehydrogenase [Acidobacteriota bacterium]